MSGAEALLGLVASGAGLLSLAIQLGESAAKLSKVYRAARNAPRNVETLVFDLEFMRVALDLLERQRQRDRGIDGALLEHCLITCRRSAADIERLVDRMARYMADHSRVRGRLYAVFKEREMRDMLNDLERAKSSLSLAIMMYLTSEQRRRDQNNGMLDRRAAMLSGMQAQMDAVYAELLQQRTILLHLLAPPQESQAAFLDVQTTAASKPSLVASHKASLAGTLSKSETIGHCHRPLQAEHAKRKRSKTLFRTSFRLPAWFYLRVWDLAVQTSQSGWSIHVQTYNIIPPSSPIIECCRLGDIAGARRLIESGEASPLDVYPDIMISSCGEKSVIGYFTLIEVAAGNNQPDVCRYLLGLTTWPDQAVILNRALSWFAVWQRFVNYGKKALEMYGLFLEAPGFDTDLEDPESRYRWLNYCFYGQCLEMVLAKLILNLPYPSLEAKFELLIQVDRRKLAFPTCKSRSWCSVFLECLGLQAHDKRLAMLTSGNGVTALHYAAFRLGSALHDTEVSLDSTEVQEWSQICLSVLKNGADPFKIARWEEKLFTWANICFGARDIFIEPQVNIWRATPLQVFLSCCYRSSPWGDQDQSGSTFKLRNIRYWAEIMRQAGFDLLDYGAKENTIWRLLGPQDAFGYQPHDTEYSLPREKVFRLVYGPVPSDWSFTIRSELYLYLRTLDQPPGAFTKEVSVPTSILWQPTTKECEEGEWKVVRRSAILTKAVDVRDSSPVQQATEPFTELVDGTQDDSGVIVLLLHRNSRARRLRPRSRSQPPSTRHRKAVSSTVQQARNKNWLEKYHLCPSESRWHLGCWTDVDSVPFVDTMRADLRYCIRGPDRGCSSAQASYAWNAGSFLAEIDLCQRRPPGAREACGGGYTGDFFHEVRLDRLNVPRCLQPFHPGGKGLEYWHIDYESWDGSDEGFYGNHRDWVAAMKIGAAVVRTETGVMRLVLARNGHDNQLVKLLIMYKLGTSFASAEGRKRNFRPGAGGRISTYA